MIGILLVASNKKIKNSSFDCVFEQPSYKVLTSKYIYILQLSTLPGISRPLIWQNIPQSHSSVGVAPEFTDGRVDSSNEGADILFSGYYKCQKYPKKIAFNLPTGG